MPSDPVGGGGLREFVRESNRIENIVRDPLPREIAAHERLLSLDALTLPDVVEFVADVAGGEAPLRSRRLRLILASVSPQQEGGGRRFEIFVCPTCERQLHPLPATPDLPPVCFGWGKDHDRAVGVRVTVQEAPGA